MITLPREPWRGGQLCGYQSEYGVVPGRSVFCGELKEPGLYFCKEHHDWVLLDGPIKMAPGNVAGLARYRRTTMPYMFQLSWEPYEGDTPTTPTPEELAAYQAQLKEAS